MLFDVIGFGVKEMDLLGFFLFWFDFFICIFYKGFGEDLFGFFCLFVNKFIISILKDFDILFISGIVSLIGTNSSTFF